jgi:predicted lipoprotein with Yx(FWY)xxD motif
MRLGGCQVKNPRIFVAMPIVAALLAGCGSSNSSSTSSASTAAATPAYGATSSTPTAASAALVTSKHNKLGTILAAGPKRLTVYLFAADTASKSACTSACATVWPPVTTNGQSRAVGGAMAADLGTITRPDGTMQVTYKGHPLYFYAKDGDAGDAYGEGLKSFGADWYVLTPAGKKIDKS